MQALITALIVAACSGYATWSLMPQAWRRALLRRLGREPAPTSGCGACGGCDGKPAPAKNAAAQSVITVHPRQR